jgi:DNA-directed RNA polymerase subunit RPC12/RpoP
VLERAEFRRLTGEIHRRGFRRSWPLLALSLLLMGAGIATDLGWLLPRAVLPALTVGMFAGFAGWLVVFTVAGERAARGMGLRCGTCGAKLYGGARRDAVTLDTGRCLRCGTQVLTGEPDP